MKRGNKLSLLDQADLQGEQTEEEVLLRSDGGHATGLPYVRRERCADGPRPRGFRPGRDPHLSDYRRTDHSTQPRFSCASNVSTDKAEHVTRDQLSRNASMGNATRFRALKRLCHSESQFPLGCDIGSETIRGPNPLDETLVLERL